MITPEETNVHQLGETTFDSPLKIPHFITEGSRIIVNAEYDLLKKEFESDTALSFENAGPRKKLFFNPAKSKAAIVTCGGLCPGLNNVVHSLVHQLYRQYGVTDILGIRYGYEGLVPSFGHPFLKLTPDRVSGIDRMGGTILGTSRGAQDVSVMVDTLKKHNINMLFTVGGDGTLRGAEAIHQEVMRRDLKIAIVGVPKTIDNDISFVDRTFGFETAVAEATAVVNAALAEASSARNGIGLVRLMGRESGFIAAYAALACNEANYCLIPEVPFALDGKKGFLNHLHQHLNKTGHAVIVLAEGAGQEFLGGDDEKDISGNRKLKDIGIFLRDKIISYFKEMDFHINLKYIDPSYTIRSVPPSSDDAVSCLMLAQNAVHGAMAGKSGIVIGKWNNYYTFIPIPIAIQARKKIDRDGYLWSIVKEATGQPDFPGDMAEN